MARALELAALGLYTTDPNPRVGCVLVRDDRVDAFKNKVFRDVLHHLKQSPGDIEQARVLGAAFISGHALQGRPGTAAVEPAALRQAFG